MRHPMRCDRRHRSAMTPMSALWCDDSHVAEANSASPHGRSSLARALHDRARVWVVVSSALFAGCIIPPSLSVDNQDAGIDSPPSITSVRSLDNELVEPGPVTFTFGEPSTLNLTLLDTDIKDALYVRIFVNYSADNPTAPRSFCQSASGSSPIRTATCDLQALCLQSDVGATPTPLMTVIVFDRQVLDTGKPAFQAMPPDGQSTSRTYLLDCLAPS
jgi:hypothetical protein